MALPLAPPHSITSSARASSVGGTVEAERLGGRQIDDEIELGRLLDREVGRLRPAQNLVDIVGGAPEQVREVRSIGHQTSRFDKFPKAVHRRQSRAQRQRVDANRLALASGSLTDIKCIRAALERLEGGRDILGSPDFERATSRPSVRAAA